MTLQRTICIAAFYGFTCAAAGYAQEIQVMSYTAAPAYAQALVSQSGIDPDMVAENGIEILTGDATGDGNDDALVIVSYFEQNSVSKISQILVSEDGQMVPAGTVDVYGESPRDFSIENGAFLLTTTVAGPNDQRCCPTQPQRYRIPFPQ